LSRAANTQVGGDGKEQKEVHGGSNARDALDGEMETVEKGSQLDLVLRASLEQVIVVQQQQRYMQRRSAD
jgi:hypothetical protein